VAPTFVFTPMHVETCPEYDSVRPIGWGVLCYDASEKQPECECPGNPVRFAAKEKFQIETDYAGPQGLEFTRHYSSTKFRSSWSHTYAKRLTTTWKAYKTGVIYPSLTYIWDPALRLWISNGGKPEAVEHIFTTTITGPNGYGYSFTSWDRGATWFAESDVNATLTALEFDADRNILKWRMTTASNDAETYDGQGKLIAIEFASGRVQTLTYSDAGTPADIAPAPNLLIQVGDNFGRQLQFRYDATSRMIKMIDPAGKESSYTYHPTLGIVDSVTHPDGLKRVYHYDEAAHLVAPSGFKHVLTGISDELSPGNLVRYGTYKWSYDLPASTEHAGGVYKYTFDFINNTLIDPLGAVKRYSFATKNGRKLQDGVGQPNGNGAEVWSSITHDDNGNPRAERNLNGVGTVRIFNLARNLESSRVEGSNPTVVRTISTQWHATLRLPLAIAGPLLRTTMTYDPAGRLTSKTKQATADTNGSAAFGAALIGKARKSTYTYTDTGLLRTKRSPRTDVDDTTTYDYDAAGNLTRITNAANHIVTLSSYDANGRPGRVTDANNLQTDLTYSPRGWLTSSKTGSEITTYDYDGVGHMTRATVPGGLTLTYTYDPAQRLTGIADNLGNSITYTLDNMGNRLGDQVRDPNGTLARQTARIYDVLGRVKQVTGAQQ